MKNPMEKFEELFKEKLESEKFEIPSENATHLLPIWNKLLDVSSLYRLDCDVKTHGSLVNELLKDEPEFNLFNVSFLINTLTKTSPKELEINSSEYQMFCFYSDDLAKLWNDKVLPIRNELVNKLQTQAALQMPKNGKNVIPPIGGPR